MKKITFVSSITCLVLFVGGCRKEKQLVPSTHQPQEEKSVYGINPSADQSLYYWADLLA